MPTPLVSVIIPTYNRGYAIKKAIQSVLDQSFKDFELWIIDDGSQDDTKEIVHSFHDNRIFYYYQANQGVSVARNKGILFSRGRWISFLDSDDCWKKEKLEIQLATVEQTQHRWIHSEEIWIRNHQRINPKKKHTKRGGRIYIDCLPLCVVSPSAVMIEKKLLEEVGLFDPLLPVAEDYDLWLRIASREEIGFISKPLIEKYGGHKDQLSQSFLGMDRFRIRALLKHLDSPFLNWEEKQKTLSTLVDKINIVIQGYAKRNKKIIADYYRELLSKVSVSYETKKN